MSSAGTRSPSCRPSTIRRRLLPLRIRLLQLLREGERTVGSLQAALELDSGGTSQHLAALRKQGLVGSRREGTNVYYRLKDTRTLELLELAKRIISANLEEGQALLDGLAVEDFTPPDAGR